MIKYLKVLLLQLSGVTASEVGNVEKTVEKNISPMEQSKDRINMQKNVPNGRE